MEQNSTKNRVTLMKTDRVSKHTLYKNCYSQINIKARVKNIPSLFVMPTKNE